MVVQTMDGSLRDHVLKLMKKKDEMEAEIARLTSILERNGVGMTDSLVDEEDFPRSDVDVYQVRNARHQIICLQNDHKTVMNQIERGLHELHSSQRGTEPGEEVPSTSNGERNSNMYTNGSHVHMNGDDPAAAASFTSSSSSSGNRQTQRGIVKVDFVSPGSPAEESGMQVNDEIIEFGSVNPSNFKELNQIAAVVQHSINSRIRVKLLRGGFDVINIFLTPHTWSGRGLLGCNIVPIS